GCIWLWRRGPAQRWLGALGVGCIAGLVALPFPKGVRFVEGQSEWIEQGSRAALSAAAAYADAEPNRPIVFLMRPPLLRIRAWGIANQWAHIILAGMNGDEVPR